MARYNVKSARVDKSPYKQTLLQLGEDEAKACVLASLMEHGELMVRDLHRDTGYSIPAVVNVLRDLKERGWVEDRDIPNEKRGRNPKCYSLSVSKGKIEKHYKQIWQERIARVESGLVRSAS